MWLKLPEDEDGFSSEGKSVIHLPTNTRFFLTCDYKLWYSRSSFMGADGKSYDKEKVVAAAKRLLLARLA